jgi:hypothetical protein
MGVKKSKRSDRRTCDMKQSDRHANALAIYLRH